MNDLTYFGTGKGSGSAVGHRRTGSYSGYKGQIRDEMLLFVSPFAEPANCSLSAATQTLSRTVEYIKQLLEISVLRAVRGLIKGIQIDMLPDIAGKWYFLGIEEYQVELGPGRSLPSSPERSIAVLQASAPTNRILSPVPDIRISKVSSLASPVASPLASEESRSDPIRSSIVGRVKKTILHRSSLTLSRKQSPVHTPTDTSFKYILSKGSVSSPKELVQVREMEKDIADLIGENAALTHMTYRSWQRHIKEGTNRVYSLDRLYANTLSKKEKLTRDLADGNQRSLRELRTQMIEKMAAASLNPNSLLGIAGNFLLDRLSGKKVSVNTAEIHKLKQKMQQKQQIEMNKTAGTRIAKQLVTYAASHLDVLKASARVRKKEFQQERDSSG
jgi:hypothetical protein